MEAAARPLVVELSQTLAPSLSLTGNHRYGVEKFIYVTVGWGFKAYPYMSVPSHVPGWGRWNLEPFEWSYPFRVRTRTMAFSHVFMDSWMSSGDDCRDYEIMGKPRGPG